MTDARFPVQTPESAPSGVGPRSAPNAPVPPFRSVPGVFAGAFAWGASGVVPEPIPAGHHHRHPGTGEARSSATDGGSAARALAATARAAGPAAGPNGGSALGMCAW